MGVELISEMFGSQGLKTCLTKNTNLKGYIMVLGPGQIVNTGLYFRLLVSMF